MRRVSDRIRVKGKISTVRIMFDDPGKPGWRKDPNGLYIRGSVNENMIVLAGLSMMAKSIQYGNADAGKTIRYMAVGEGYTIPSKSQTALVSEVARLEIDSWDNTDVASDPVVMIASKLFLTTQANGALMECSLQQESSGTPMFSRGLFGIGYIEDATNDDPIVITSTEHGLSDGDKILIEGVAGMTELNSNMYYADVLTADTFALYSDDGLSSSVDGAGYGAFEATSPNTSTWKLVIPKTTSEVLTVTYGLTFPAD